MAGVDVSQFLSFTREGLKLHMGLAFTRVWLEYYFDCGVYCGFNLIIWNVTFDSLGCYV